MEPPEATADGPDAGAGPVAPVSRAWMTRLGVAGTGLFCGWFGPIQVLLGLQAAALTPDHKEATLTLVTGVGAAVSTLANPVAGALSDRTRSRRGRRVPWVVGGALVGALGLVVLALAQSVPVMVLGWCIVQAGLNGTLAGLTAAVPDLVPVEQRGLVSGVVGMTQTLGIVIGTAVASLVAGIGAAYLVLAVLVLAAIAPFALRSGDRPVTGPIRPWPGGRAFLAGFWISPRRHPDFAWAWLTRFLATISNSICTFYLLYFLTDAVRVEDPEGGVLVLTLIYAAVLVATAMVAGAASDRIGRRKPFVMWSGLLMSAAAAVLAFVQTWPAALVGAVVLGVGYGVYISVDFALITQVLPSAGDRARDLGVINIANALPQVLAPALAGPLITWYAANSTYTAGYRTLYLLAAAFGVAAALLITRIRSVD